jgi:hypothetical protein
MSAREHPVHALGNYIDAGDERAAVALAKSLTPGEVNEALRAALAPWESGVIYNLARDLSTGVDVEIVAEILPPLLADAALEPDGLNSLALTDRAKAALSAVALQTAPESRQAAMTQIRSDLFADRLHSNGSLWVGWPGASQPPAPTDPDVTVSCHPALLISVSDWLRPLPLGE